MAALGVGLLGAGRMGRVHARHLAALPDVRVVAVADPFAAAARDCAQELGAEIEEEAEALLSRADVEAVVIASATDCHAGQVALAARHGVHVFCEKPIDLALPPIDEALRAVQQAGVSLQVGFNRRFDAGFAALRERIAGGEIGVLEQVRITSRDIEPPPAAYIARSGGLFLDMTIHDFDLARFLAPGPVKRVFATGDSRIDPNVAAAGDVDAAVVVLELASGLRVVIENSRRAVTGYDQRAEAWGSEGTASAGPPPAPNGQAGPPAIPFGRDAQLQRYLASYRDEVAAFVTAVREGAPTPVSGVDGREATRLALAARASLERGAPVALDEVGVA